MEKYILAFETSGTSGGAALVGLGGEVVHEVLLGAATRGGEGLLPAAQECLAVGGISVSGLSGIAVDLGPGSFTGLRVGVMSAKALAFAAGIPVWGVCSLDALAMSFSATDGALVLAVTARRNEIYFAEYGRQGGAATRRGEVLALSPEDVAARLAGVTGAICLAGSGAEQLREKGLLETLGNVDLIDTTRQPAPSSVGMLAVLRMKETPGGDDLHALQPVYPRRVGVSMPVLGEPVEGEK